MTTPDSAGTGAVRFGFVPAPSGGQADAGGTGLRVGPERADDQGHGARPVEQALPRSVRLLADALGLTEAQRSRLGSMAQGQRAAADAFLAEPAQLPVSVAHSVGRVRELRTLDNFLSQIREHPVGAAVVISAIAGTAGMGKTALAVHWAHRAAAVFPDG